VGTRQTGVQALLALAGEACTPAVALKSLCVGIQADLVPTEYVYNDEAGAWEPA